jgi:hypothetical protein
MLEGMKITHLDPILAATAAREIPEFPLVASHTIDPGEN